MIKVAGAKGPILVYRGWTEWDIEEALAQLPSIAGNGKEFTKNLMGYCKTTRPTGAETRRVLVKKLRLADVSKLEHKLSDPDIHMVAFPRHFKPVSIGE